MKKYIALGVVFLSGFILVTLLLRSHPPLKDVSQDFMALKESLTMIQQSLKKPVATLDLTPLKQDVGELRELIHQLQNKSDQQFDNSQSQLQQKLDGIQQVLQTLDDKQHPIKYLPTKALPFNVISIDSIQQISVVTVIYDFKTIPLEKHELLAGWSVVNVDFGKQYVEFENKNKERVKVIIPNEGDLHA